MSEYGQRRREDMPLHSPNEGGNVWPRQKCPAFFPRSGVTWGIKECWYCVHADFHLNQPRSLEVGVCYWPHKCAE